MKSLFSSRGFWVALLTLFVIVVGAFVPNFGGMDVDHTAGLVVIVSTYMIGLAISPGDQLKPMLMSRKFWAAGFGVTVIFLDAFHVWAITLDIGTLASLVVILAAYVLMLAKDPGMGWRGLLVSRKFWATLVGLAMVFLNAFKIILPAGFSPEQIISIAGLIGGYIASVGLEGPPLPLPDPVIPEEDPAFG
jgi:hypothetical protein